MTSMLLNAFKTYQMIRAARASSYAPPARLRQFHERRLKALLVHAYQKVPLYRQLYAEAGFHPDHFRSLQDIERIPSLSKERLKAARPEEVVARGVDPQKCQTVVTSGSTGVPMRIYLGPHEVRWQRAAAWRILFEHGYRWTDRTLEIRKTAGPSFLLQRFGIAPKDWLSILDPPESWARRLVSGKYQVLVAGAGTLHALAEAQRGRTPFESPSFNRGFKGGTPPLIIISDSETLAPATRRLVHRVLGSSPVDVFGLVELSNFAWQCERREGFHISADSHLVEIAAPPAEPGPIIVTDLGMWTMPIIRYDTGDMAEWDPQPCPCGRTLPVLKHIYGRAIDSVLLPDGKRLFWPFFHEVLGAYDQINQWRLLQEDQRHIRLQLALPGDPDGLVARIESQIRRALPEEVQLVIERVDAIPIRPEEKTRMIQRGEYPPLKPPERPT